MTQRFSQSERIAEALRETPPELDDVARARMERRWLASTAAGRTARASRKRGLSGRYFATGLGLGFAAAAALFLWLRPAAPGPDGASPNGASPSSPLATASPAELRLRRWAGDREGPVSAPAEGSHIATSGQERARLTLGRTLIDLSPGSLLVPERLASDVRMRLERGGVRVEFNPERPGEEGFVIETRAARIEVVGTAFRVEVGADASTDVAVEHGVVRVTTLPFGDTRDLHAGESVHVEPRRERRMAELGPESAASVGGGALVQPPGTPRSAHRGLDPSALPSVPAEQESSSPLETQAEELEAGTEPAVELAPSASAERPTGPPLDADAHFALASRLSERGRYEAARHELYAIVRRGQRTERARAWSLVADTRERERDWSGAGEAYRRAAEAAPQSGFGRTALFALARVRELRLRDREGALHAYRAYLHGVGRAPLAEQARHALCRLGDLSECAAGEEPAERPPLQP